MTFRAFRLGLGFLGDRFLSMRHLYDPLILFSLRIRNATELALDAFGWPNKIRFGEAQARARGYKLSLDNSLAILAAVYVVESFKGDSDRREHKLQARLEQRTSSRRLPLRDNPRLSKWYHADMSPAFYKESAEAIDTDHADRLLALMWLAFFQIEAKADFDWPSTRLFEQHLLKAYRKPRTAAQAKDAVRKLIKRRANRPPDQTLLKHYRIPHTDRAQVPLSIAVFARWKIGVLKEKKSLLTD